MNAIEARKISVEKFVNMLMENIKSAVNKGFGYYKECIKLSRPPTYWERFTGNYPFTKNYLEVMTILKEQGYTIEVRPNRFDREAITTTISW